jgi:hypothetical protein
MNFHPNKNCFWQELVGFSQLYVKIGTNNFHKYGRIVQHQYKPTLGQSMIQ